MDVFTYPCLDLSKSIFVKEAPDDFNLFIRWCNNRLSKLLTMHREDTHTVD